MADPKMRTSSGTFARLGILGELLQFMWKRKLGWIIPMIFIMVLFSALLIFAEGSAIAPFIYTLF